MYTLAFATVILYLLGAWALRVFWDALGILVFLALFCAFGLACVIFIPAEWFRWFVE